MKGRLEKLPTRQIVAAVRDPQKSVDLRDLEVEVRNADYDRPETLLDAFTGIEKLLFISAVVPGERFRQHKAVIDLALRACRSSRTGFGLLSGLRLSLSRSGCEGK